MTIRNIDLRPLSRHLMLVVGPLIQGLTLSTSFDRKGAFVGVPPSNALHRCAGYPASLSADIEETSLSLLALTIAARAIVEALLRDRASDRKLIAPATEHHTGLDVIGDGYTLRREALYSVVNSKLFGPDGEANIFVLMHEYESWNAPALLWSDRA